ncbi:hypothetical protein THAOC_18395 [Thalassiosira oceanica]|uniref:Uncharacterized protein n=1 Tax=Thalassiosira oceanica TaxID=159749 RepID=K0SSB2_THAOC|nr:hypothetical protein THAOC_18395 [Thalassiosira oceanica]|eukprot:EJK61162.1 hypothetical protein THAOC_18395 [Thalassiosira oceanica]
MGVLSIFNTAFHLRDGRTASSFAGLRNGDNNDCLSRVGTVQGIKLYSQNDEDGALLQTLRCMGGHGTKEYFEFGSETGMEVNTRVLRDLYGWRGHLLDGGNENPEINLHQEWFTPTNIVSLLEKYGASKHLDVLSVDTDYDDLYITREILLAGYRPRVLINEYNVNFGSQWSVSTIAKPMGKEEEVRWRNDCYFGASAMALINLNKAFGYTPVFSNHVNLIFVNVDLAQELDLALPSVENFPGPKPLKLHGGCSHRTWKRIDAHSVRRATNTTMSHAEFADSLPDVALTHEDFGDWRIFQEEKE